MGIHFWHGLQQGDVLDSFNKIVTEWNKGAETPVILKSFNQYGAPVTEAFKSDPEAQPSLVLAPEFMTSMMMGKLGERAVISMDHLLPNETLSKIAAIVQLTFGSKEQLPSLPFNPACGILYMNQDMLKEIGKDASYSPRTLKELEEVCQELIEKGIVKKGYTCAWPAAYLVEIPAAQQNIALVEPNNGKQGFGEYRLNKKWLIEHFQDLRRLQKQGIFHYAGRDNTSKNPFLKREVAFFMQGSSHYSTLQKETDFELGFGIVPTLTSKADPDHKYAFPLGGAAIWALNNQNTEKMKEGVIAFLSYLASDETQELWHKETAYVPVSSTLPAKLEEFYKDHALHKSVVEQTINSLIGEHSFGIHAPNYKEARDNLFALIEKILSDETDESDIPHLLQEFDERFSIQKQ